MSSTISLVQRSVWCKTIPLNSVQVLTYARLAVGPEFEVRRTYADDRAAQLIGSGAQVRAPTTHDGGYDVHSSGLVVAAWVHCPVEHVLVVRQVRPAALAVCLAVAPSPTT